MVEWVDVCIGCGTVSLNRSTYKPCPNQWLTEVEAQEELSKSQNCKRDLFIEDLGQ